MKGIILAGGKGSRLLPLTQHTNKHLLRVHDRPMIHFPVLALRDTGIREILIVTDPRHAAAFGAVLGDGGSLGIDRLQLAWQPTAAGIADALRFAEPFAAGDRVCVLLGDNLFQKSLARHAQAFERQKSGARFLLTEVADPKGFGVAQFDGPLPSGHAHPRLRAIVEKPPVPPSPFAVTGAYFYDAGVFDLCLKLRPSGRGELEITDLNNAYIARGDTEYDLIEGWWTDAGTHESLERAARLVASNPPDCVR